MASTIFYLIFAISYVTACTKMVPPDIEGMPVTDMPVTDEPITGEPITNEPVTDEPVTEEPITEEPVTEDPITEEPITEEPVTEEPVTEEPVTDAPGDCTTCQPESLIKSSDLTEGAYYTVPEQWIEPYDNAGCNALWINCFIDVGMDVRLNFKDPQGVISNGPTVDYIVNHDFQCDDEGKWVSTEFGGEAGSIFCEMM